MSKHETHAFHLNVSPNTPAVSTRNRPASSARPLRLFRNTYTRNGERRTVRKWMVKIQHEGRRHTVALQAGARKAAMIEAKALRDAILAAGWENALRDRKTVQKAARFSSREQGDHQKNSIRYWRQRLIQRKYLETLSSGAGWSARIEHGGEYRYFFLAGREEAAAAEKALEIYRSILDQGWRETQQRYCREFTVAVFWSQIPFTCTYTTLLTHPSDLASSLNIAAPRGKPAGKIWLVEPDQEICQALQYWLSRHPGWHCTRSFRAGREALQQLHPRECDLILANRLLTDITCLELAGAIKRRFPGLPVFSTGIFEESDQIFMSVSGVRPGYFLQRRYPFELLNPLQGALLQGTLASGKMTTHLNAYFREQLLVGELPMEAETLVELTLREREILNYLSKGLLDKEIADALKISPWTVHNHLKRIFQKMGVHTRTEAVVKYLQK
jgi:DNA-binding NarL/FixJ family response regulator